jgi:hypothetical protein
MSRKSTALDLKSVVHRVFAFTSCVPGAAGVITAVLALASVAAAQNADTGTLDAYLAAIRQSPGSSRAAALERFASGATASNLKLDALEWIVWEERQTHNDTAAETWARQLLSLDSENALGLAITVDAARRSSISAATYHESAQRGLNTLARLRRPEGMSRADFTQLRQQVEALLNAATGCAELERKYYAAARVSLARAVVAAPNDAQLVYALALADLSGEKPNRRQGYWMLAKAVNLSGGGASARQMEEFGRKKYKADGGTDRDWDQYLASTAAPGASAATMIRTSDVSGGQKYGPESRATRTGAKPSDASKHGSENRVAQIPATRTAATPKGKSGGKKEVAKKSEPARGSKSGWKGEPEPPPESSAAANALPPISGAAQTRAPRAGPPVSLGILMETSLTGKGTRRAIVYSLRDLVRHFGPEDEGFILSFSNDLVFEEDLTGDAGRLEKAMDEIKPHPGTALLDAVGFAAGHLRRISKNDSRVLLVISDGRNADSRIPGHLASSEIRASGVKVYCIGVDVGGTESMSRLQALATGTGGTASFITAPDQFRAAAQQVAGSIGIPFQF